MNNLLVACGINVDPYKLHLKTAHHTAIVYKSLATLKTTCLLYIGLLTTWRPARVREKVHGAPIMSVLIRLPGLGSASPAWTSLRAGHSWSGKSTEDEWQPS